MASCPTAKCTYGALFILNQYVVILETCGRLFGIKSTESFIG